MRSVAKLRYWREMGQLFTKIQYLKLQLIRAERIDRVLIFLVALTSNSSIISWTIWQRHAMVWGAVIACSHVILAIREHLPYTRRVYNLRGLSVELEELSHQMERDWKDVNSGEHSEEETQSLYLRYRARIFNLGVRHLNNSMTIPENYILKKRAEENTRKHFEQFYLNS